MVKQGTSIVQKCPYLKTKQKERKKEIQIKAISTEESFF